MEYVQPDELVDALRHNVLFRTQVKPPFGRDEQRKLNLELMWLAANEIERLRGVIARNCDPGGAASEEDADIIRALVAST